VVISHLFAEMHVSDVTRTVDRGARVQDGSTRRESKAAALEGYSESREGIFDPPRALIRLPPDTASKVQRERTFS
jgi:hypothetical protein